MNALQLVRQAQLGVDAIRTGDVESDLWSSEETLAALNTGMNHAAQIIRLADSDLLTRAIESNSGETLDLVRELYETSTLSIVEGTKDYTLPFDLIRVIYLVPITTEFEAVTFKPGKSQQRQFMDNRVLDATSLGSNNTDLIYWYTILGQRTLRIVPAPTDSFDVELLYQYRPPKLNNSSSGTINVTHGERTVTGSGTSWLTDGIRAPAEIIIDDGAVNINQSYPTVLSIENDNALTLARPWLGATITDSEYRISMVPQLPEEHHEWLGQYTGAILLRKVNPELSDKSMAALKEQFALAIQPELEIRQLQESLTTEPFQILQ